MAKTPKRTPANSDKHPQKERRENRQKDAERPHGSGSAVRSPLEFTNIKHDPEVSTDIRDVVDHLDLETLPDVAFEPIHIDKHNFLLTQQPTLFVRFNENTDLSRLLLVNPVLAFREAGITMEPEIARHILRSVYQPTRVRERLAVLSEKLERELDEVPKPHNPQWAADFLFKTLKLKPLAAEGVQPIYKPPRSAEAIKKLNDKRPKPKKRYDVPGRKYRGGGMSLSGPYQAPPDIRQLDLEAELPDIPTQSQAPTQISFEELYFYKDDHPTVKEVLEFGILQKRGIPIHSADSFRKIQSGEKGNLFYAWISAIRFSDKEDENEPHG